MGNHAIMAKSIGSDTVRARSNLGTALGAEMTSLRVKKGWSQNKFAHVLGYDERYIRQLEKGLNSPTLRMLSNIAEAFDMPLSTFIKRVERKVEKRKTK